MSELSPTLARIPYGTRVVPLDRSVRRGPGYFLATAGVRLRRTLHEDPLPAPFLSHEPWMSEAELIRHTDFVRAAVERSENLIAALPFIDDEGVERCYREHLAGEDRWRDLYTLLTFLETPVARRVASEGRIGSVRSPRR